MIGRVEWEIVSSETGNLLEYRGMNTKNSCRLVLLSIFFLILGCSPQDLRPPSGFTSPVESPAGTSRPSTSIPSSPTPILTGIPLPPQGYLYAGVFPGGVSGEEDDIDVEELRSYEQAVGKPAAWVYFSNNWYRSRSFPLETASWIREAGSLPFIRLMLRPAPWEDATGQPFTLQKIIDGNYDQDFHSWCASARSFGTPLLAEYGTEVNGRWFPWNGLWNGGGRTDGYGNPNQPDGPERFQDAYRHIIRICRQEGAQNIIWVFHVNAGDNPEVDWNRLENYYPGDPWIDWLGVSDYGAQTPLDEEWDSFRSGMDQVYPRLAALAPDKPIVLLEFGVTKNNPLGDQALWARQALTDITSFRYPRLIGFSWWNEGWQNDDDPAHDTTMRLQDNPELAAVFQQLVGRNPMVLGRIGR